MKSIKNIITNDEASAKFAINYLKKNNLGRVTFFPLNIIKDKYIVFILMAFAIAFSLIMQGIGAVAVLQGIICWGVSVGIKQLEIQFKKVE